MVALLTPIAKAYMTDRALDSCIAGQQVFGGHGYIREWGQEQLVRDARITQIYEGTNGIQSLDLMGRKIVANGGKLFEVFAQEVSSFIEENQGNEDLSAYLGSLSASLERLSDVTSTVIKQSSEDPNAIGAASVDYLDLFGLTAYAYLWARMVKVTAPQVDSDTSGFYKAKVQTANFFFSKLLPKTLSLAESIKAGPSSLMDVEEAMF